MFMAEKGIEIPQVTIDLRGGENRRAPYNIAVNPAGQTPALELDDGSRPSRNHRNLRISRGEIFPETPLIGTAAENAQTPACGRAASNEDLRTVANGFRYAEGLPLFEPRMRCLPEAAAGLKAIAQDGLAWLDPLIAGRDLSLADELLARRPHAFRFPRFRGVGGSADRPRLHQCPALVRTGEKPAPASIQN